MSDSIWTNPTVEQAVEELKRALRKALAQPDDAENNLMISLVTQQSEMEIFYEGCTCPKCAMNTIKAVSNEVFGIRSEVVKLPKAAGGSPKVH